MSYIRNNSERLCSISREKNIDIFPEMFFVVKLDFFHVCLHTCTTEIHIADKWFQLKGTMAMSEERLVEEMPHHMSFSFFILSLFTTVATGLSDDAVPKRGSLDQTAVKIARRGWMRGLGTVVAAPGLALYVFSTLTFSQHAQDGALVEAGPFQYTRNPVYVGMLGTVVGAGIMSRARLPLAAAAEGALAAVPLGLYLQFRVIPAEERYLRAKHGEAYTSYVARTPRWLLI